MFRFGYDSDEMKRHRSLAQMSDEWSHVAKQWVELRHELDMKRKESTLGNSGLDGNCAGDVTALGSMALETSQNVFACAMPKSTVEIVRI